MHQCSASDEGLDCGERLIGREVDLDRVRRAFARSRLVTITGGGGVGKTSLARAYARNGQGGGEAHGRDGVAFVSLAAASSPGEVPGLVADALGVRLRPGVEPGAAIALSLSGDEGARLRLVVLDNFEHLLYASRFVEGLREACPAISLLVTSRVGLGLRGERLMPLAGLSLRLEGRDAGNGEGAPLAPALRLMVERIGTASPGFSPSAEEEAALLDLCRRLEGNPLSIVLAAARIAMNPELARSSPDTLLDFVAAPGGRRSGRHASLEDTLEWSYRLLPSPPRVLLAELGAFAGRVSLPSLEAFSSLGPELPEALAELERTGFLRIEARGGADSVVARPEAVAEFSSRLLARTPFRARALEAREALYAALTSEADAEAASGGSGPASARLLVELPSLRDAVARAASEGHRSQAATMALAAYRPLQSEGRYAEGLAMMEACLEGPGALEEEVSARLSSREAGFLFRLGRLEEAAESLSGAIGAAERLGDEAFRAEL